MAWRGIKHTASLKVRTRMAKKDNGEKKDRELFNAHSQYELDIEALRSCKPRDQARRYATLISRRSFSGNTQRISAIVRLPQVVRR